MRAHIVDRLFDYKWSSYPYYAYKRKAPLWLKTKTILSQVPPPDYNKSYRIKVQKYSEEEGSFFEDLKHGFIFGTQDFIDDIKKKFLKPQKDIELPNKNSLFRECNIDVLLQFGSRILGFGVKSVSNGKRVGASNRDKRDLLLYMLWKNNRFSYKEIGSHFGLSYSAVSKRVKIMNQKISKEKN